MIEKDMTATDRQFMIECLCEDIVPMIMEEYHLTDKEAFDRLYKSKTFSKIEDPQRTLIPGRRNPLQNSSASNKPHVRSLARNSL